MPTLRQLAVKGRRHKVRRCTVAALKGAPQRKGIIIKLGITTPKKPNSAKRKYARVGVMYSDKVISAHPPGEGETYLHEHSVVMVEGGSPPDVPGINYSLIRGCYDFRVPESFGRKNRRSKFGCYTLPAPFAPHPEAVRLLNLQERLAQKRRRRKF
jgi:small subunit ribosomal protein S12